MDIVRDFTTELFDPEKLSAERLVVRSLARGLITEKGAAELLAEIWRV